MEKCKTVVLCDGCREKLAEGYQVKQLPGMTCGKCWFCGRKSAVSSYEMKKKRP